MAKDIERGRLRIRGRALVSAGLTLVYLFVIWVGTTYLYPVVGYLQYITVPAVLVALILVALGFALGRKHRQASIPVELVQRNKSRWWRGVLLACLWCVSQYPIARGLTWIGCHALEDAAACELRFDGDWTDAWSASRRCEFSDKHCAKLVALPQREWEKRELTDYAPTPEAWLCRRYPGKCAAGRYLKD